MAAVTSSPLAMNDSSLQLPSFAKVNWSLRVLGKRQDGYHEIDTILQTVSLHDDLVFAPREDAQVVLDCDDPRVPTDRHNLIVKAAEGLRDVVGQPLGADIHLTKRIPMQGGLGGGSSNAAVTLLALNHLWQSGLAKGQLEDIGRTLGSDVPFFFVGGTARGTGRGADIAVLPDTPKKQLLIITPTAMVPTAAAYEALKAASLTTVGSTSILSSSFAEPYSSDRDQWALCNDFEGVIFEIEPEIKRVKLALLDAGAQGSLLAGSGSSVFGIFENEDARERALAVLKNEDGWRIFSCDTVSREEYSQALNF